MGFRKVAGLLLPIALVSCEPGVVLTVARSNGGSVDLRVASESADFRACIDSASIYLAGQPGKPVWELGRGDPRHCAQRVTIGTAKPGFAQRSSSPLLAGRAYCAEVNGPGFSVRRGFTVGRSAMTQDAGDPDHC